MDITIILTSISLMAIIILIGVLIGSRLAVTLEAKQLLMTIIVNVAVPAIIFNGIFNTEITNELLADMLTIFLLSVSLNTIGILLGWGAAYLFGFRSLEAKKLAVLAGIGNTGFIGIPLCAQIFGPVGGLLAAIFDSALDVVTFSLVIMLLQQGRVFSFRQLKALVNIPFIAIMIGLTMAMINYQPPAVAKDLAGFLANLAAPLAMIYIGLLIPGFLRNKQRKVAARFVTASVTMKLVVIPLVLIGLLQTLSISDLLKQITYIQVAMPTFMLATVLIARYTNDEESAVVTTVYSTLLSLVSIPVVIYIANLL
ncbi:AEC family transporter [Halalkalibacter oceani]|uniref:AEC family transporter n=1 Tax=Halalkalibacter oceani TaxID=1653776 RepID=A0A9X2DQ34_9BACI|nr:AEC family transporter [Halalkalibacter oceani]